MESDALRGRAEHFSWFILSLPRTRMVSSLLRQHVGCHSQSRDREDEADAFQKKGLSLSRQSPSGRREKHFRDLALGITGKFKLFVFCLLFAF